MSALWYFCQQAVAVHSCVHDLQTDAHPPQPNANSTNIKVSVLCGRKIKLKVTCVCLFVCLFARRYLGKQLALRSRSERSCSGIRSRVKASPQSKPGGSSLTQKDNSSSCMSSSSPITSKGGGNWENRGLYGLIHYTPTINTTLHTHYKLYTTHPL